MSYAKFISGSEARASIETLRQVFYFVLCIGLACAYGLRSAEIGADTKTYLEFFEALRTRGPLPEEFERIEFGFYLLTWCLVRVTDWPQVYLAVIFLVQFIGLTYPKGKRSWLLQNYLYLSFAWLAFPFFYSISLNVLRQGIAFAIVLYALDRRLSGHRHKAYLLVLVSAAFHYGTLLFFLAFLVADHIRNVRFLILMWLSAGIAAYLGFHDVMVKGLIYLANSLGLGFHFLEYARGDIGVDYETGFRLRFAIFSAIPVIYFWYLHILRDHLSFECVYVMRLYLVLNSIYFFSVGLPYNDRIALMSWLLMPLVVNVYGLKKPRRVGIAIAGLIMVASCMFLYQFFYRDHLSA